MADQAYETEAKTICANCGRIETIAISEQLRAQIPLEAARAEFRNLVCSVCVVSEQWPDMENELL